MAVQIRGRQVMDSTITAAKLVLSDSFNFSSGTVQVSAPSGGSDAANKDYVDGLIQGLHPKESVRVLSKTNIDISSAPAAIDGVTMANKDRVCLTGQTTGTENGIYKYSGSGSAMSRTGDADTFAKLQSAYFFVQEGTSANEGFVQTAELTSFASQTYVQFSSAGNIVAGDGLAKSGNTLSVNVDGSSLEINSDALRVKAGGIINSMLATPAITIAGVSTNLGGAITADTIAGQIGSGKITNAQLANATIGLGGVTIALGSADNTPAFDLQHATGYPTSALVGSISNAQLGGSIANGKLENSAVSLGGVSISLGGTDATPAFDLQDATGYPTSSLVGSITNAQLSGSIENGKLSNSAVSFGGVSVSLGGTDATPAFNLQDATGYPSSSLVGSVANSQLANKAITIAGASTELGGSITAAAILGASNTDALSEGSSNKYYTDARARAAISVTDTAEIDLSYAAGAISAALKGDSVELSKVAWEGKFESFTANGSTKDFTLSQTLKLGLAQGFTVAVNGLLMDYNASPSTKDDFSIDNGGEAGKGRIKFGANLNNNDVVTIRYYA